VTHFASLTGASNSTFHQLPAASYSDPNLTGYDLGTPFFQQYSPQTSSLGSEPHEFDFAGLGIPQNHGDFNFDVRPPSPIQNIHTHSSSSASTQENHVMYYFENVRKLHFLLGSNAITNVTYSVSALNLFHLYYS
jgi:hypothetical protein